jgi:hypothetical protein
MFFPSFKLQANKKLLSISVSEVTEPGEKSLFGFTDLILWLENTNFKCQPRDAIFVAMQSCENYTRIRPTLRISSSS